MRLFVMGLGVWLTIGSPLWAIPLPSAAAAVEPTPVATPLLLPTTLPALVRQTLDHYFRTGQVLPLETLTDPSGLPPLWRQHRGVFVTLTYQGQMRGCWGSLTPTATTLAAATIRATIGAATRDHRYPRLRPKELPQVRIQVALIRSVTPITSLRDMDPTRSGLWIRSGALGAVLLPGEALTTGWQLATARRLAGIPPQSAVELFRVDADLLHEF